MLADAGAVAAAISLFGRFTPNTIVLVALAVWALALGGHYRPKLDLSLLDDLAGIAGRVVAAVSLGAAYRELLSGHDVFTVDRLWVLIGCAGFVVVGRAFAYSLLRLLARTGLLRRRAVVIGPPELVAEIHEALRTDPVHGLVVVPPPREFPLSAEEISQIDAEAVVVIATDDSKHSVAGLLRGLPPSSPDVYLLPAALMPYPAAIPGAEQLTSLPLIRVRTAANHTLRWKLKRMIDVLAATALMPIAAPILLICAAVLRWEGGPGVLFSQDRVGLGGRRFTMYKLRTVSPSGSEADKTWRASPSEIFPFARFCRATSIDELPQLWNVLLGEMSLVGPRPERPHFVQQFAESIPGYNDRHRVPAGLTGLAQVHGLRGDTSISARSRYDNSYIDNWSLNEDLKILCRTALLMLTRRGRGS